MLPLLLSQPEFYLSGRYCRFTSQKFKRILLTHGQLLSQKCVLQSWDVAGKNKVRACDIIQHAGATMPYFLGRYFRLCSLNQAVEESTQYLILQPKIPLVPMQTECIPESGTHCSLRAPSWALLHLQTALLEELQLLHPPKRRKPLRNPVCSHQTRGPLQPIVSMCSRPPGDSLHKRKRLQSAELGTKTSLTAICSMIGC